MGIWIQKSGRSYAKMWMHKGEFVFIKSLHHMCRTDVRMAMNIRTARMARTAPDRRASTNDTSIINTEDVNLLQTWTREIILL